MLSKQAIEEYRIIYRNEYGKELSVADATKQANSLIRLYKAVLPLLMNEDSTANDFNYKNTA
ncbi:MAG: hypothetical protein HOG49_20165 [Candidatus Scalindua sp.]|jgi:hypothetical protein|nr:hypothetical protein [Candidatus Scalindua sp.]